MAAHHSSRSADRGGQPFKGVRLLPAALLLLAGVLLPFGAGCNRLNRAMQPDAAQAQSPVAAPDPTALDLWKKTLHAQSEKLLTGTVTVTHWDARGKAEPAQVIELQEGKDGQYRLVYQSPENLAGRVVVCDGIEVFQYEPKRHVVLRHPVSELGPDLMPDIAASTRKPLLRADREEIGGRPTTQLDLRDAQDNRLRERRWIDDETGRTLRIESFNRNERPQMRVEIAPVSFDTPAPESAFHPNFPKGVRTLLAPGERKAETAETVARQMGLPTRAGRYRVRTALPPRTIGSMATQTQLIYGDSLHAVSLFVTTGAGVTETPISDQTWHKVQISSGQAAYTHEDSEGRTAVAWVRGGRRYVAIARLPLSYLLPLVRSLVG